MKAGVEKVVIIFFLLRIYFQMGLLANFQGDIKLQAKGGWYLLSPTLGSIFPYQVVSTFPHQVV